MIQFQNDHITVFQSALYQTTTAIIQTEDVVIMTDPNWLPSEIQTIQNYVAKIVGQRELYIIYTHSDFDHIIAAGAFPTAKTIASATFASRTDKEIVLQEIEQFDAQYYVTRDYEIIYPQVDCVIEEDGQILTIGATKLTFYLAPGHTDDGLFTVVEPFGILLAGDYLSDVEFPFLSDWVAYYNTLQKAEQIVAEHSIVALVPGHGMTTIDAKEMTNRIQESMNYLNNLKQGIDQQAFLQSRYAFYKSLKEMHEANQALMKNALSR